MLQKVKEYIKFYVSALLFSTVAYLLGSFSAGYLIFLLGSENTSAGNIGWYIWYVNVMVIVYFLTLIFLWNKKRWARVDYAERQEFCEKTAQDKEKRLPFSWKAHYQESVREIYQKDIIKYAVWCILPAATCFTAWCAGYSPYQYFQLKLPGSTWMDFGMSFFKVQHIFFDLFSVLRIFCVPVGLLVGGAVYVAGSALVKTLLKEEMYGKMIGKASQKKVEAVHKIAKFLVIFSIINFVAMLFFRPF